MTMTVSVRIKGRSASLAAGQRRHDLRHGRIPNYVSIGRIKENSIIIKTPLESRIQKECVELRELNNHHRAMKSDAAIVTTGIVTFGKEAQPIIKSLSKEDQDEIYLDIAQRIARKGNTKLLGLVVHRDEQSPHAHFTLRAVNNDGLPLSKVFQSQQTKELQDLAGQVLAEHGYNEIKRGKPKKQRIEDGESPDKYTHKTPFEMRVEMQHELAEIRAEVEQEYIELDIVKALKAEEKADFEKYQRYITKTKEKDNIEESKRKNRMETYEKRMQNAIDSFAKLHEASPDKVREAFEKAGIIEPQVMFAGSENADYDHEHDDYDRPDFD